MKPIFEIAPEPIPKKDTEILPLDTNPSAPEIPNPEEHRPSPRMNIFHHQQIHPRQEVLCIRLTAPAHLHRVVQTLQQSNQTAGLRRICHERNTDVAGQVRTCKIVLDILRMTLNTTYLLDKTHWLKFYFNGIVPQIARKVSFLASSEFTIQHLQRESRIQT